METWGLKVHSDEQSVCVEMGPHGVVPFNVFLFGFSLAAIEIIFVLWQMRE